MSCQQRGQNAGEYIPASAFSHRRSAEKVNCLPIFSDQDAFRTLEHHFSIVFCGDLMRGLHRIGENSRHRLMQQPRRLPGMRSHHHAPLKVGRSFLLRDQVQRIRIQHSRQDMFFQPGDQLFYQSCRQRLPAQPAACRQRVGPFQRWL